MIARSLTPLQARVLLLLSLEPQSVAEIATRLSNKNHDLELSGVRLLLNSLTMLDLAVRSRGKTGKWRYRLAPGRAVEAALEQAYTIIAKT